MPTICRLNGGVYGGSTDLALACDFRIGVDTAEMFMPAARLGLHYYTSGIARYVSRLGVDNAKKLFLTAQKIAAPEMLRIGYLTAMVPPEALDEEVDRLATILAGNAPQAMRGMKRAINEFARGKLDEEAADRRHRESMRGDEIKEGIKAFGRSDRRGSDVHPPSSWPGLTEQNLTNARRAFMLPHAVQAAPGPAGRVEPTCSFRATATTFVQPVLRAFGADTHGGIQWNGRPIG